MTAVQPKISAILAAGGKGTRFAAGDDQKAPKQFIELRGYPIFVWSLQTLMSSPAVANVIVVAPPDLVASVDQQLDRCLNLLGGRKPRVVPGGASRQDSVYLGLCALEAEKPDYVIVHDAARPFLTPEILDRFIAAVLTSGACTTGISVSDTVKRRQGSLVVETLDRQSLTLVQTPQGGRYDWLMEAHQCAQRDHKATTDDAAILELAGRAVSIVDGASYNLKITRPEDLILAEALAAILFADRV